MQSPGCDCIDEQMKLEVCEIEMKRLNYKQSEIDDI